ncbi:MAG: hypothetical protein GY714_32170 [Desulfobacterales bacterium]|nr:hypothetical protein [Desulfobacterales bacterium]MCP4163032.1 hypothetical protein [Deltaproteobacteria bacterium]
MENFVGKCGRYIWLSSTESKNWIRGSDFKKFNSQHSLGSIYHCIGVEGNFIVIKCNRADSYRVHPKWFKVVPDTVFYVGDKVEILDGSKAGLTGLISSMGWHLENKKIIYTLTVNGKTRTRNYWDEDIKSIE